MMPVWLEITWILLFILVNGYLALSETAIVSSRQARLKVLIKKGEGKADRALALCQAPGPSLSAIQLGVTGIGILAGVFSGATLSRRLAEVLSTSPVMAPYAEAAAIAVTVSTITLLSLVFGELVPKRLALLNPEKSAMATSGSTSLMTRLCSPLVAVLEFLSTATLKIIGAGKSAVETVTEDEVEEMVAEGRRSGVFHRVEQEMISGILKLDQILVGAIMTPRLEIAWIDTSEDEESVMQTIADRKHERFPVAAGNLDHFTGIVNARDVLASIVRCGSPAIEECAYQPLIVPESKTAFNLLEDFRISRVHAAMVIDEHGSVKGLITVSDILDLIVGQLREAGEELRWEAIGREDGTWLIDAIMPVTEFRKQFDLKETGTSWYQTAGGLVLHQLEHIPSEGETLVIDGVTIEIIDMDDNRIDKLLVRPRRL
ncbi:MAG: HlyC/CorC family transporter [Candidatus Melainabacteria bacterium]|nr:HlyC/CorC family transporter [Candidatus Melainabacteria bacterium]